MIIKYKSFYCYHDTLEIRDVCFNADENGNFVDLIHTHNIIQSKRYNIKSNINGIWKFCKKIEFINDKYQIYTTSRYIYVIDCKCTSYLVAKFDLNFDFVEWVK